MTEFVLAVFVVVYVGMILGGLPGLALDRAGVALLGAIALLAGGAMTVREAWGAVDVPTMALLFALMVISAQFRLGGFYAFVTRKLAKADGSPPRLLFLVILAAAVLSAVLANDIVCLAMTPILVETCRGRDLDPLPYLLGLACAANIGSAATLIGNPQNMLIGQVSGIPFGWYFLQAAPPVVAGLVAAWGIIAILWRGRWRLEAPRIKVQAPDFSPWQSFKGCVALVFLVVAFLIGDWPREVTALFCAGVLLSSRRLTSGRFFSLVDWPLLILFMGLFVVNHAVASSGLLSDLHAFLDRSGLDLKNGFWLGAVTVVLSNVVSNVPAVMLLLPADSSQRSAVVLALASTFAGNFFLLGSIANLIVADQAGRLGVSVGWRTHFRVGFPVTVVTLILAGIWLYMRYPGLARSG
ncbi:SLC13 family permease [Desulfolutivibrio sulfoxidireducens]|uniref:SLC13 family permease n=1 Tax=Desulfolutivibrio sulfoxidireducens TaxID=2773299 RepID=UPI00159D0723|nr:SLC13 family permease [Desulfolutivibrio sulfoxidireducens]QLA16924.1 anion transporter [Desulfolutivibrio sulfoxidireducens]QLA20490.1 anion transporter [Desulfolutivibrio sulfoxidireducens]